MRRPSMPRQRLDEPLDLGFGVVEMWGTAEAADARCDFDFFVAEVLENFFMVQGWGDEADAAAPLVDEAGADEAVAFGFQAGDELVGQGFDAGDGGDADGLDHLKTGAEGQQAGDVVGAALEAGGVGAEGKIVFAEILGVDDVQPAEYQGAGVFDQCAAAEENAGAFGA